MKYKKNALSKLFMMLGGALAFSAFAQQFEPQSARTVGTVVDPKGAVYEKLTVISIAPLLARAIREVFEDGSVTSLFDGHS